MPGSLVEQLLDRRPAIPRDLATLAMIDEALRACCASARRAWPELALTDESFAAALAERLPDEGDPLAALASMCTDDLFLACACARKDTRAIAVFERHFAPELAAAFRRFAAHGSDQADLRQLLLERLFVAAEGRPPKIAEYSGRGSLRAWLKVVASRLRIDRERRKGDRPENFTDDDNLAALGVGEAADLHYLKQHYREQFKAAFVDALAQLDAKERALLRLNAIEGLSATDIAQIYKVHRATSKRWLADAREHLVATTQRLLAQQLGGRVDLASIVNLIRSDLDVSLARHLAEGSG